MDRSLTISCIGPRDGHPASPIGAAGLRHEVGRGHPLLPRWRYRYVFLRVAAPLHPGPREQRSDREPGGEEQQEPDPQRVEAATTHRHVGIWPLLGRLENEVSRVLGPDGRAIGPLPDPVRRRRRGRGQGG